MIPARKLKDIQRVDFCFVIPQNLADFRIKPRLTGLVSKLRLFPCSTTFQERSPMASIQYSDTHHGESQQHPSTGLWQSIRHLWCRHGETFTTPKTDTMPAHLVCRACGWREPVIASMPQGTRTWDSSRDEARYQLEKKRREAFEEQRQMVMAKLAMPAQRRGRRTTRQDQGNLLHMKPAIGE
jgi:hypothetical protein